MNEWIIINNGRTNIYEDFNQALDTFLTEISSHLWLNSFNNKDNGSPVYDRSCTPSIVSTFFEPRYSERTISDEEIVVQSRLDMLLDYFLSKDATEIKNNALKAIKHSIKYHSKNEDFKEVIDISVELNPSEIIVDIEGKDGLFKTNAFIFDNDLQKYYFKSKHEIITSNDPQHLGKMVELDIKLQPYDDEIIEELYDNHKELMDKLGKDNKTSMEEKSIIVDGLNVAELVDNEFKNHSELMKKLGEDDEEDN